MKSYSQITFDFTEVKQEDPAREASLGVRIKSLKSLGTSQPVAEEERLPVEIDLVAVQGNPAEVQEQVPPPGPRSTRGRKSMKVLAAEADLVDVPEDEVLFQKQYYSIGEVSGMFRVNPSLLRFWEAEFDIIQPRKNRKGDRHFRPVDIKNLLLIHDLLRRRKLTIEGAKDFLKRNKKSQERFEMIQSLQKIRSFLLELRSSIQI